MGTAIIGDEGIQCDTLTHSTQIDVFAQSIVYVSFQPYLEAVIVAKGSANKY